MGAGHGHRLHYHGHSPIHRARPQVKLVALIVYMLLVVATPADWFLAFAVWAAILLVVILVSRVPLSYLAKRLVIELPFVLFAILVPFVATGPQVEVLGVSVSSTGLLAAWGLLVKGTLGVLASLTLAATTEPVDVLRGLERLRMPDLIVQIMGFMIRYLDVVTSEMSRMMVAMRSRGCDPQVASPLAGAWPLSRCIVHPLL